MRLGIMQPYFFPYIGYISLIKNTDLFILFDTVQFIRHGWIERNRILKPNEGWQYISVPLEKHKQKVSIQDIRINNEVMWRQKLLAQLVHYKKAPYYEQVMKLINEVFEGEYEDIVTLNKVCLLKICKYLNIQCEIEVFSNMRLEIGNVYEPDEWALNICKSIPMVNEYWNPPGGMSFFDKRKYEDEGINLKFQRMNLHSYWQQRRGQAFEPNLSILDVMMFNSVEEIHHMLDDYELI